MIRAPAVAALFPDLDVVELTAWIERRWVRADAAGGEGLVFREIDVARVRLIHDLRRTCDVPEEVMPVLLSVLDQLYEARGRLAAVRRVIEDQPVATGDPFQDALRAALDDA